MKRSEKKRTPVERLVAAMDACAIARGEAQWTNGYRSGSFANNPSESDRLYAKELGQWVHVGHTEQRFRRLAQRLLREARDANE